MAMKYAKAVRLSALIVTFVSLIGCATQQSSASQKGKVATAKSEKAESKVEQVKAVLQDSEQYIPVQAYDENGNKISYIAMTNPYIQQEGVIEKGSVARFITARRAFKSGDLALAKKTLLTLTSEDNSLAGPWVMLGHIDKLQNKYEDAEKSYVKAIEINPLNVNAHTSLAYMQRLQGKFRQAQNSYVDALRIWKDFPEAHLNLAILYDVYLNDSVNAQKHMEAYQFLTNSKNDKVALWAAEIQQRTGIQKSFIDTHTQSTVVKMNLKQKVEVATSKEVW